MYIIFVLLIQTIFLVVYLNQIGYIDDKKFSYDEIFNMRILAAIVVFIFGLFQIIAIAEYTDSVRENTINDIRINGLPEKTQTNENKHTDM